MMTVMMMMMKKERKLKKEIPQLWSGYKEKNQYMRGFNLKGQRKFGGFGGL